MEDLPELLIRLGLRKFLRAKFYGLIADVERRIWVIHSIV